MGQDYSDYPRMTGKEKHGKEKEKGHEIKYNISSVIKCYPGLTHSTHPIKSLLGAC